MTVASRARSKAASLLQLLILKANYALDNYGEVIWLVGDGRSGTTWVCDLINHDKKYREMFEPFHPRLVDEMGFLQPHQYVRPHERNDELLKIASDVFRGNFMNPRVDANNRSFWYRGLLVKDIFANLFCYWAAKQFPGIRPVLLMRNPFAVALSKCRTKHWGWATDPLALLNQVPLYQDHLQPFEDLIRKTSAQNDYVLNQILTWSIINFIPLRQFASEAIHVCFYEKVCMAPSGEISKLLRYATGRNCTVELAADVIGRPSRVTKPSDQRSFGSFADPSWRNELPSSVIDGGLEVLECFGLADLYDERSMPDERVLSRFHAARR